MKNIWHTPISVFITCPANLASYFAWLGPLLARLVVGEVFMLSGWGKLQNLATVTENFAGWGIPFAQILTPFVSGVEFVCGLLLLLGLLTRLSAVMLAVVMLVAIRSALWPQVDSLDTLLGFSETAYFAIFIWLAIAGAGKLSLDSWLSSRAA